MTLNKDRTEDEMTREIGGDHEISMHDGDNFNADLNIDDGNQ